MTRARLPLLVVVALTALGAALRFPTLDRQSLWLDELVTVSLLDRGLGDVLHEIPRTEATPFVYYVAAWVWGSVLGLGEIGLEAFRHLVTDPRFANRPMILETPKKDADGNEMDPVNLAVLRRLAAGGAAARAG